MSAERPVIQCNIDGTEIKRFKSAVEAERETDISSENIAKACKGKRTYAGGFIWRYLDMFEDSDKSSMSYNESSFEIDVDKGTMKSHIVTTFEAKSTEELAKLHKIDTKKYKISNYWSKLRPDGRFTSSVLASLKKLGDNVDITEFKEAAENIIKSSVSAVNILSKPKISEDNEKALIFCVSDEHIACSNDNSLYVNKWDESEYFSRKMKIIQKAIAENKKHGSFDKIIILNLGDNLDGFNGQTTRGGHTLPQNMTNKEAIEVYSKINIRLWDNLINFFPESKFEEYDMANSNHGGLGWDAAAALVIKTYLDTKYPNSVKKVIETKLIGSFKYGVTNIMYTHGKDDKFMKSPYPLNLNDNTETKIKQWMDLNGIYHKPGDRNLLIKGDIHKFNWNEGKFFDYINCPSLMGSTDWIMHNFGNSAPGILTLVLDKNTGDSDISLIRF